MIEESRGRVVLRRMKVKKDKKRKVKNEEKEGWILMLKIYDIYHDLL